MKMEVKSFGPYEKLRILCKRMKDNEAAKIEAARIFAEMLPENPYIVPMPGHLGYADYMLYIAKKIFNMRHDSKIYNIIRCRPHESLYVHKHFGLSTDIDLHFTITEKSDKHLCFIDNVYDTGKTWKAVRKALDKSCMSADLYVIGITTI